MDHLQHSIKHIVDNVNKVVIFFWKNPTSRKCYYAKWFKFKPQSHISLATFPNLCTSLEVFEIHIDICSGRLDVEMDSIEFLFLDAQYMSKVVGMGL